MPRAHEVGLAWPVSLALRVQSKRAQPAGAQGRCYCGARLYHREPGAKKSSTKETLAAGKEAFGHYCVVCHGLDGQATGFPFADRMSPPIPSLASRQVQLCSDGQLKWVIDNGLAPSGMPASKGTLSAEEIWSIVYFLRHLPPAGSLGEPDVYSH